MILTSASSDLHADLVCWRPSQAGGHGGQHEDAVPSAEATARLRPGRRGRARRSTCSDGPPGLGHLALREDCRRPETEDERATTPARPCRAGRVRRRGLKDISCCCDRAHFAESLVAAVPYCWRAARRRRSHPAQQRGPGGSCAARTADLSLCRGARSDGPLLGPGSQTRASSPARQRRPFLTRLRPRWCASQRVSLIASRDWRRPARECGCCENADG